MAETAQELSGAKPRFGAMDGTSRPPTRVGRAKYCISWALPAEAG